MPRPKGVSANARFCCANYVNFVGQPRWVLSESAMRPHRFFFDSAMSTAAVSQHQGNTTSRTCWATSKASHNIASAPKAPSGAQGATAPALTQQLQVSRGGSGRPLRGLPLRPPSLQTICMRRCRPPHCAPPSPCLSSSLAASRPAKWSVSDLSQGLETLGGAGKVSSHQGGLVDAALRRKRRAPRGCPSRDAPLSAPLRL